MRFVNASDDTRDLPTLGENGLRVAPGEEFDATGDDAKNLQADPSFRRVDKPSKSSTDTEEK